MTVLEAIQKSADFLAKKGVESPRLQIELLLAHLLKLPRMKLYLNFERTRTPAEVDALRGDASKARGKLGWAPKVSFSDLVKMMIEHDLELAEQEKTLIRAGHIFRRGASLR